MNVTDGSEVRLTLVGRQVVVEPADDTVDDGAFRRASAPCCAVTAGHSSCSPPTTVASGGRLGGEAQPPLPLRRAGRGGAPHASHTLRRPYGRRPPRTGVRGRRRGGPGRQELLLRDGRGAGRGLRGVHRAGACLRRTGTSGLA